MDLFLIGLRAGPREARTGWSPGAPLLGQVGAGRRGRSDLSAAAPDGLSAGLSPAQLARDGARV